VTKIAAGLTALAMTALIEGNDRARKARLVRTLWTACQGKGFSIRMPSMTSPWFRSSERIRAAPAR